MGWDYVSELRSSADLLFTPGWYEYGEPRWNDIDGITEELVEKKYVPFPLCVAWNVILLSSGYTKP
jgi:hypothetical protein